MVETVSQRKTIEEIIIIREKERKKMHQDWDNFDERQRNENAIVDKVAKLIGLTENERRVGSGWVHYDAKIVETLESPPYKKGYSSASKIKLAKTPSDIWLYGTSFSTNIGGAYSGAFIWNKLFETKEDALASAIEEGKIYYTAKDSDGTIEKALKKKSIKWLNSIMAKDEPEIIFVKTPKKKVKEKYQIEFDFKDVK